MLGDCKAEPALFHAPALTPQVISRDTTTFLFQFPRAGSFGVFFKVLDLRVMMGSKSRVCVATSEAQTCPIWISRDMMSSYRGGKAWQKDTRQGRVGMKNV